MAIDTDIMCFPNNVQALLTDILKTIDPETAPGLDDGLRVENRPVRPTDGDQVLSVVPGIWVPEESSQELGNGEPTLQRYTLVIEALVVDTDEERGIATHSLLSALVRHKVYRDPALKVALPMLSVNLNGYKESLKRWGITQQRFLNNSAKGNFVFLSAVEFWFETDIQNT